MQTFGDWQRAAASGAEVAIAVPITAGNVKVGSLQMLFGGGGAPATGYEALLLRCCRAVGAGLQLRREALMTRAAASVVKDMFPSHLVPQLLRQHTRGNKSFQLPAASSGGGSEQTDDRAPRVSAAPTNASSGGDRTSLERASFDSSGAKRGRGRKPRTSAVLLAQRRFAEAYTSVVRDSTRGSVSSRLACAHAAAPIRQRRAPPRAQTVVFCDIVGFTPQCHGRSAVTVMAWLDHLFTKFDKVCDATGLYKARSIGGPGFFRRTAGEAALAAPQSRARAATRWRPSATRTLPSRGCSRDATTTPQPHCASRSGCTRRRPKWRCNQASPRRACASACTPGPSPLDSSDVRAPSTASLVTRCASNPCMQSGRSPSLTARCGHVALTRADEHR